MPVAAADLIAFASANMPVDDVATSGGAIDLLRRVVFTDLAADDDIEVISTAAGDTQNCTIKARDSTGVEKTETKALTGTTAAIFSTLGVVKSVQSVELASAAIGTITVRRSVGGLTIATIAIGERGFMRLFRGAASEAGATTRYEKFFWKNTHASLALLAAVVKQSADPSGKIQHGLATAKDDTVSVANRKTVPTGVTFDDTNKNVPGTDLLNGQAIGVWLYMNLLANDAPIETTYTSEISGQSA